MCEEPEEGQHSDPCRPSDETRQKSVPSLPWGIHGPTRAGRVSMSSVIQAKGEESGGMKLGEQTGHVSVLASRC